MKLLAWNLVQLLRRNRNGVRATQYARKKIVMRFAQNVQASGARNKRLSNLKQQDFARAIQPVYINHHGWADQTFLYHQWNVSQRQR